MEATPGSEEMIIIHVHVAVGNKPTKYTNYIPIKWNRFIPFCPDPGYRIPHLWAEPEVEIIIMGELKGQ